MPIKTITIDTDKYAVVPIEPTPEMALKGALHLINRNTINARYRYLKEVYQAMLSAAPPVEDVK